MAVAVAVSQVTTNTTYTMRVKLGEDEKSQVSRGDEVGSTTAALLGFMGETAQFDADLSQDKVELLRLRLCTTETSENRRNAELVGKRLRGIGDDFMSQFLSEPGTKRMVEECLEDGEGMLSPQTAYTHFCEVVKTVFDCDKDGVARKINLGRIAGILSYCFYLCKTFLQRHMAEGIVGFIGVLLGYLIRFLLRSKFFEWLVSVGGWRQLVAVSGRLLPRLPLAASTLLLTGALVLAGFLTIRWLTRGRLTD